MSPTALETRALAASERALDAFDHTFAHARPGNGIQLVAAREHERDARRRYHAAVAAAFESLRRAERRFDQSAASIDAHIQKVLSVTGSLEPILAGISRHEAVT